MVKSAKLKKLISKATFNTENLVKGAWSKPIIFVEGVIKGMELSDWSVDDYYIRDQAIPILREILNIKRRKK